jgi:hypothetical protein
MEKQRQNAYPEEEGSVCFQNFPNYIPVYCKLLGSTDDRRDFIYSSTRSKLERAFVLKLLADLNLQNDKDFRKI